MHSLSAFYRSTVGKKFIMGLTGLVGIGFLLLHMVGNLQAFLGARKLNEYSGLLHGPLIDLLWVMRIVLIVAIVLHVLMSYQLKLRSMGARPIGYQRKVAQTATLSSRTMLWGGTFLLAFIVFHLGHFTTGRVDPAGWRLVTDTEGNRDVYGNIVASFRIWWVSVLYIVALLLLGLHLYHGAWSSVRSLGYAKPSPHPLHRRIALVVAVVIWLGFTAIPVAVVAGLLR